MTLDEAIAELSEEKIKATVDVICDALTEHNIDKVTGFCALSVILSRAEKELRRWGVEIDSSIKVVPKDDKSPEIEITKEEVIRDDGTIH